MKNHDKWLTFITELRQYIELHKLGPSRQTDLYNKLHYFRKKMKAGTLDDNKSKELEDVLSHRDLSLHTGGRKRKE